VLLRPSVLCPVDFSEASRGALRYAAAVAEHFYATLTVLAVDEMPIVLSGPLTPGESSLPTLGRADVERFVANTFGERVLSVPQLEIVVAAGKPSAVILRHVATHAPDLVVMSTHGRRALRKALFGSTTERVLREATVPILVTPPEDAGPASVEALKERLARVLVPVDLSAVSARQVRIAQGLAEAFDARLSVLHVMEAPSLPARHEAMRADLELEQFNRVQPTLNSLLADVPPRLHAEAVLRTGSAPDEIAAAVTALHADLVVIALHSNPAAAARMGSVTYSVLCQVNQLVLALPPSDPPRPFPRREPATARSVAAAHA
jgi:nucleotide-binding universal stress UspA family protein